MRNMLATLKRWIPTRIKAIVSVFLILMHERALSISLSSRKIRKYQKKLLEENYGKGTKKLIIFLTPGVDVVNGGILSIASIFEETRRLKHIHGAEALLCTYPSDPPLLKYTRFKSDNMLFDFSQVLSYFDRLEHLILHIPEHIVSLFLWSISINDYLRLRRIRNKQINIMIQNIELLPSKRHLIRLRRLGELTCTTAHKRYSTMDIRNNLGFPLHYLSTFLSPENYGTREYHEKENLMIVTPEGHPRKLEARARVMNLLAQQFRQLRIQIIENLTYEEYKETISKAKWALTLGEGLDGYFIETVFSGGVSFAVYNTRFFTEDFRLLRTVYDDYDVLAQRICKDVASLDNELAYSEYQNEQFDLCHKYYDHKEYIKNLEAFYKRDYTYK
jgi:hypothetical protein